MRRKLTRTRIVLDNHMAYNALRGKWVIPFYFLFKTLFRKTILDSADSFVAISDDAKVFMYELYGIPLDRIDVIPLGCDTRRFVRDEKLRRDLRRHYDVGDGHVVFCYAGKVIREKGVKTLIEASLELMRKRSDIFVVCIGAKDERYFREIMERITLFNCQKRFVFVDPVPNEQLPRYYSMADVGVWPKQSSIAMIEAMSMGLPIIISNDSGVLERTDEGKSGLSYRADDFLDLSRKMEIMLDEKRREQMSLAARCVAERSDWDKISELFQGKYRSRSCCDDSEECNE
jgi:glycosyltransferase involved in cell wall biosynthesis